MALFSFFVKQNPGLVKDIRIAHIKQSPEEFVKRGFIFSILVGFTLTFLLLLFAIRYEINKAIVLVGFLIGFMGTLLFSLQTPKGITRKREREINKEILFAGRYLLVKLESGMPLFNALIDISESYGVAAKYFKEIVDDIQTGTPIEEALEAAKEYSASEKLKRILWQIVTSLKTGVEVSEGLRNTLQEITEQQILEIKAYGKTLNSLMMFYMIIGVVMPSLGMALFTIFASFMSLEIGSGFMFAFLFLLAVIQGGFIIIMKGTRPMVNI
jgi:pilus assembly protein TadC